MNNTQERLNIARDTIGQLESDIDILREKLKERNTTVDRLLQRIADLEYVMEHAEMVMQSERLKTIPR